VGADPIRVMIVDDHEVVRAGVAAMIAKHPEMHVVAQASNGDEAIRQFRIHHPDVTVIDLAMPGLDGAATICAIRRESSESRFIVLSVYAGDEDIHQALDAGAQAYLLKTADEAEIVETVRAVHAGLHRMSREAADRLQEYPVASDLTPRELQVLQLLARGLTNKEMGVTLGVSETTAKWFVKNILQKLGAHDRTQAVTTAFERGILRY
jgi:two-component system, NarL family, response regulator